MLNLLQFWLILRKNGHEMINFLKVIRLITKKKEI